MTCSETNCRNISCALCFDCEKSLCLTHIIVHHRTLIDRHLSFYPILQELYEKLHSMSIEQCFRQVIEQSSSSSSSSSSNFLAELRSIREELIEQLNQFKQSQFFQLKEISQRLADTQHWLNNEQAEHIHMKLDQIRTSISSLVYGIHLEMSSQIQCRKIFRQNTSMPIGKSSSWSNGLTKNYWKVDNL